MQPSPWECQRRMSAADYVLAPQCRRWRARRMFVLSNTFGKRCQGQLLLALALFCFSFSEKYGPRWPAALPGPLCGGEVGSTGPQGSRQGCRFLFVRTGVLSKSPAAAHELAAQGWAASAKRGGLSLWLAFSLVTQRESNSAAEGRRKLFASGQNRRSAEAIPAFAGMTTGGWALLHARIAQGVADHSALGRIIRLRQILQQLKDIPICPRWLVRCFLLDACLSHQ
jgi:hypothetical protein